MVAISVKFVLLEKEEVEARCKTESFGFALEWLESVS
jgi:hypothetical protein